MSRKVVHMTTVHHPFDTRIYHKECKSLSEAGFDVTLIVTDNEDLSKSQLDNGVKIKTIERAGGRLARMTKGSIEAYKLAKELDADIYHFHDPELIPVGLLLRRQNKTVIYDIHEDYETSIQQKKYLYKPLRNSIAKAYAAFERMASRRFELCLAEKYYRDKFPSGMCILNYPIKQQSATVSEVGSQSSSPHLVYTGSISEDRGALIHPRLLSLSGSYRLDMVGKCPVHLADRIAEVTGSHADRLRLVGVNEYVPRETIDRHYRENHYLAGLALFPHTEHYARKELTKFFEYMNAGLPIICSDFPKWKEFVEEYRCGIAVNPDDDSQIKEAVEYLAANPAVREQMGRNGQEAVQSVLNWQAEAEKLVTWYKSFA